MRHTFPKQEELNKKVLKKLLFKDDSNYQTYSLFQTETEVLLHDGIVEVSPRRAGLHHGDRIM